MQGYPVSQPESAQGASTTDEDVDGLVGEGTMLVVEFEFEVEFEGMLPPLLYVGAA